VGPNGSDDTQVVSIHTTLSTESIPKRTQILFVSGVGANAWSCWRGQALVLQACKWPISRDYDDELQYAIVFSAMKVGDIMNNKVIEKLPTITSLSAHGDKILW
jgi:hypothetical protein